jgi:hypothetical protein
MLPRTATIGSTGFAADRFTRPREAANARA